MIAFPFKKIIHAVLFIEISFLMKASIGAVPRECVTAIG
jgi:hypothetical protein